MEGYSAIGKRVPRIDGFAKVTGSAKYTEDIVLPNMLLGKVLHSPYPHARILNIDVSKALRVPGVKAVITGEDTPKVKFGVAGKIADQYPLALDKVRYIGDDVAAVAAIDEEEAEEALELIQVDYDVLPAIFDPEEAMKPDAPKIHDGESNISGTISFTYGDVEKGFKESHYVREDRFLAVVFPEATAHCPLELNNVLASYDPSGRVTVWVPSQTPFGKRRLLAKTLKIPESMIHVAKAFVGGAFGARAELISCDFCAVLLSMKTGKPVRITYTREEVFTSTRQRHPMIIDLKTGVAKDGALLAMDCRLIADTGAYNSTGPLAIFIACSLIGIHYRIQNINYKGYSVYTNKSIRGAMRGHGSIQITFAIDSQLDMIAKELGMDPLELR